QFGPLANAAHFEKILGFFARARASNTVICGARALDRPGYFVEPTVVLANDANDPLLREETFGPIVCVLPFDDEEQLLALMNDSP
ncbi:aldehyde dehydrogenase family protein, partial [Pseudomonas sp. SIMBA_059]